MSAPRCQWIWILCTLLTGCGQPDPASRPSVLLLTMDTTRADALGCYGGSPSVTPNLDALAASGARFVEARTVAPITLPSHCSMLTGLFPFEHGVRDNGSFELPGEVGTLTEILSAHGYQCGAVIAAPVLNRALGLAQGFDEYRDLTATSLAGPEVSYRPAEEIVDDACDWLNDPARGEPFFLWAHFFDPHRPLQAPQPYQEAQLGRGEDTAVSDPIERERRLYAAEVSYMDDEIGRLLTAVRAVAGDELIVAAVSDHGEGNGDHRELAHGYFLYDTTIQIPLLISGPGIPGHLVVETPVSTVDLMPTILDLLQIEGPPVSGVSLVPLLSGSPFDAGDRPLYFESVYPYTNHRWSPLWGLKAGPYKLIESPRSELFDLDRDPEEAHNVLDEHPRELAVFRARLASLGASTRESARRTLSEEERLRMQQLGYVGADPGAANGDVWQPGVIQEGLRDTKDSRELIELHGLAYSHYVNQDFEEAARLMLEAVEQDPDNPNFLASAGQFLLRTNSFREAEVVLKRATTLDPMLAAAWRKLATTQRRLGKADEAIDSLQHLLATEPEDVKVRLDLAQLLYQQRGLRDEAIQLLEDALELIDRDNKLREQVRQRIEQLRGK